MNDSWVLDDLIESHKQHQRRTRGLRDTTFRGYERHVRVFARGAWEQTLSILGG
jgi:hypothetical protein